MHALVCLVQLLVCLCVCGVCSFTLCALLFTFMCFSRSRSTHFAVFSGSRSTHLAVFFIARFLYSSFAVKTREQTRVCWYIPTRDPVHELCHIDDGMPHEEQGLAVAAVHECHCRILVHLQPTCCIRFSAAVLCSEGGRGAILHSTEAKKGLQRLHCMIITPVPRPSEDT